VSGYSSGLTRITGLRQLIAEVNFGLTGTEHWFAPSCPPSFFEQIISQPISVPNAATSPRHATIFWLAAYSVPPAALLQWNPFAAGTCIW
jgi:hypothetical protein